MVDDIIAPLERLITRARELCKESGSARYKVWNVITALRSCDSNLPGPVGTTERELLKWGTTIRVRQISGIGETHDYPLNPEQIDQRDTLLEQTPWHFKSHFRSAMRALKDLGYEVPEEELVTL